MCNELGTLFRGNSYHFLGNAWPCNRRPQEVPRLIDGVAFDGLEHEFGNELFTQVANDALGCTAADGLGLNSCEVFRMLSNVGTKTNDLETFFTEPFQNY
jgi:hypothetical protein